VLGFVVEVGLVADEMGSVGDVYAEQPLVVGEFAEANGVVEVAGVGGIDGDDGLVAGVLADTGLDGGFAVEVFDSVAGVVEGGAGEIFFEAEAAHDGFEFGGRGAGFSEAFEDDAVGEKFCGGVIEDFDEDLVAL